MEKRLSPRRRGPRQPLLPLSPKNHSFVLSGSRQIHSEPTDVLRGKSAVCGLNGLRPTLCVGAIYLHPRPPKAFEAVAPTVSFRESLCFASLSAEKYGTTVKVVSQLESLSAQASP